MRFSHFPTTLPIKRGKSTFTMLDKPFGKPLYTVHGIWRNTEDRVLRVEIPLLESFIDLLVRLLIHDVLWNGNIVNGITLHLR